MPACPHTGARVARRRRRWSPLDRAILEQVRTALAQTYFKTGAAYHVQQTGSLRDEALAERGHPFFFLRYLGARRRASVGPAPFRAPQHRTDPSALAVGVLRDAGKKKDPRSAQLRKLPRSPTTAARAKPPLIYFLFYFFLDGERRGLWIRIRAVASTKVPTRRIAKASPSAITM